MSRTITEFDLQRAFCIWLDGNPDKNGAPRVKPALHINVVYFHVPNGGARNAAEGSRFKQIGVKAGIPDLVFFAYQRFYLMEWKAPGERPSKVQELMHPRLIAAGATDLIVVDNLADAKAWTIRHSLAVDR